jgi:hypothetical protein
MEPAVTHRRTAFALAAAPLLAGGAVQAKSCRQEVGRVKAQTYVKQCTEVSPATHPPCNAANACSLIIDEIKRGCGMLPKGDASTPAYCASYLAGG